jgi:AraC family transcriptional regulator
MIEAAVFDLLAALSDHEGPPAGAPPRWLQAIALQVDDTFAARPRVEALARGAGVHPVYLARCFRRHYGTSITERVRERRVERAAGLLGASRTPLSAVAHQSGFADQSHLSRVFRRATGLTPGGYRALARG